MALLLPYATVAALVSARRRDLEREREGDGVGGRGYAESSTEMTFPSS